MRHLRGRLLAIGLCLGLAACSRPSVGGGVAGEAVEGACPDEREIPFGTRVSGQTGHGWSDDLGQWFRSTGVACSAFGTAFPGPYRVYSLVQPSRSDWDIVVMPGAGVDVSIVAWQEGKARTGCAPLRGVGVVSCGTSDAGRQRKEERVRMASVQNPYRLVILVATPPGGDAGAFDLVVREHR